MTWTIYSAPTGPEGMRQATAMFRQACPDWHSDLDELIAEADGFV